MEEPYGWIAEDVYRMMGLHSSRPIVFAKEVLAVYEDLHAKKLANTATRVELAALKRLSARMQILPDTDPARVTIELKNIQRQLRDLDRPKERKP